MSNLPKQLNSTTQSMTPHQHQIFKNITNLMQERLYGALKSTNIEEYLVTLTGSAGTGKTFLTTQIAKYFHSKEDESISLCITAPTHKAVGVLSHILYENKIMLSCKTIHSFLGIKPFRDYNTGEEGFRIDKTKKTKEKTTILIVDESSMIGSELYEYILEAIEDGRVGIVLFIGDPYQLLPVDKSENKIFSLKNTFTLTEIVRQAKDSYIIKLATKIRERIKNQDFIDLKKFLEQNREDEIEFFHNKDEFLKDFYKNEKWYKENKILATHKNQDVDAFNRTLRLKYWEQKGNLTPPTLLAGDMLRFKEAYGVGDVTLYHNGQEIELENALLKYHESLNIEYWDCKAINQFNQQIFRVVDPDSMKTFNDKLNAIAKRAKVSKYPENKELWKVFYQVRDMFADVQYIYSSTIHKLQGSTYDTTYIDMFSLAHSDYISNDEKYRLLYVAVTRASKDIKIFISAFDDNELYQQMANVDVQQKHRAIDDILKDIDL
jgi:ATP-dependent exoDNAse (exonuclease V) alpha subunit